VKTQWEYDLFEKPFCEQLRVMGWEWIEGDPDLPESTERTSSRLLRGLVYFGGWHHIYK
jgi:type I restriction enzyme R subunit